jgi:nickel transport protein
VVIFAWMEGDTVFTESQFPDGKKIADARIFVRGRDNALLLEGKTDDNGLFSFKIPKITPLHIVLEAGMGHQGEWNISEEEIVRAMGPGPDTADSEPGPAAPLSAPPVAESVKDPSRNPEPGVFLTELQLEKIIDAALDKKLDEKLDKKLQPIMRSLARIQEPGPSVQDIMAGIGYIFGLMGVAAYVLSRKNK